MEVEDYILTAKLGRGAFGEVFLTKKKNSQLLFATKRILKELAMDDSLKRYFNNEIYILKHISHPSIIKFYEIKTTLQYFYLVFEHCNGGGLSNCLQDYKKKYNQPFTQEIVQYLMRQIVLGVKYLHNSRILHRDLKLDNILVCFQNDKDKQDLNMMNCSVKIIDFGFARYLSSGNLAQSVLGSPINMDPHILRKMKKIDNVQTFGYDEKADIWSLGTISYELLIGTPPFTGSDSNKILESINNGSYTLPNNLKLSLESISFINAQLQYDPKERLDINSLVMHEFLHKPWQRFTEIDINRLPMEMNNSKEIVMNIKEQNIWFLFQQNGSRNLGDIDARMINSNPSHMNQNQYNQMPVVGLKDQQEDYVGNMIQPQNQKYPQQQQQQQYSPQQQYQNQMQYQKMQPQSTNQPQYTNQPQSSMQQQYNNQPQKTNQPQFTNQPQYANQPQSPRPQYTNQIQYTNQPQSQMQQQYQIQQPQSFDPYMQQQCDNQQEYPINPHSPTQQQQNNQQPNQFNYNLNNLQSPSNKDAYDLPQETKKMLMEAFDFLNYDEICLEPMISPILPKIHPCKLNLNTNF